MLQRRLTQVLLLLALIVVSLGAYTRLKDAGLGCPDWPGCYGKWMPTATTTMNAQDHEKAWIEMIHRYAAGFLGMGILGLAIVNLKQKTKPKQMLPWLLVGLVVFQAALGMWTVTLKLYPIVVMAHLLGGILIVMGLAWWLFVHHEHKTQLPLAEDFYSLKNCVKLSLIVLFVQLILGGWTSANYAALVCLDFPLCHGMTNPPMAWQEAFNLFQAGNPGSPGAPLGYLARATVHMAHRYWALLTTCVLLYTWLRLWKSGYNRAGLVLLMALLVSQIALGVTNIVAFMPLTSAWLHHLMAVMLLLGWLTVFRTCSKITYSKTT